MRTSSDISQATGMVIRKIRHEDRGDVFTDEDQYGVVHERRQRPEQELDVFRNSESPRNGHRTVQLTAPVNERISASLPGGGSEEDRDHYQEDHVPVAIQRPLHGMPRALI